MKSFRQTAAHDAHVAAVTLHRMYRQYPKDGHLAEEDRRIVEDWALRAARNAMDALDPERIKARCGALWQDEIDYAWKGWLIPPSDGRGLFDLSPGLSAGV